MPSRSASLWQPVRYSSESAQRPWRSPDDRLPRGIRAAEGNCNRDQSEAGALHGEWGKYWVVEILCTTRATALPACESDHVRPGLLAGSGRLEKRVIPAQGRATFFAVRLRLFIVLLGSGWPLPTGVGGAVAAGAAAGVTSPLAGALEHRATAARRSGPSTTARAARFSGSVCRNTTTIGPTTR